MAGLHEQHLVECLGSRGKVVAAFAPDPVLSVSTFSICIQGFASAKLGQVTSQPGSLSAVSQMNARSKPEGKSMSQGYFAR